MPTPVYIGAIFDSTCLLWERKPCGGEGACWMYDLPQYRMKYMLVILIIKIVSLIFYIAAWWAIRRPGEGDKKYDMVPTNNQEKETKI